MTKDYCATVETARSYYNSSDADRFYFNIWGGEDIHIGLYETDASPIADASRKTVERMAGHLQSLRPGCRVIDLGAGYGGAARFLAKKYDCHVVALNLSEEQNCRDREINKAQGLEDKVEVVDASFEAIPYPDESFDVVWSQDAILHSGDRAKVLAEAARVLKPGGELIFTDPMQTDDCPDGVLQPILDRIHLSSLGSPGFYREEAAKLGFEDVGFDELAQHLPVHYARVLDETTRREEELVREVNQDYVDRMKVGLSHWVNGGKNGYLTWGILHFRRK